MVISVLVTQKLRGLITCPKCCLSITVPQLFLVVLVIFWNYLVCCKWNSLLPSCFFLLLLLDLVKYSHLSVPEERLPSYLMRFVFSGDSERTRESSVEHQAGVRKGLFPRGWCGPGAGCLGDAAAGCQSSSSIWMMLPDWFSGGPVQSWELSSVNLMGPFQLGVTPWFCVILETHKRGLWMSWMRCFLVGVFFWVKEVSRGKHLLKQ